MTPLTKPLVALRRRNCKSSMRRRPTRYTLPAQESHDLPHHSPDPVFGRQYNVDHNCSTIVAESDAPVIAAAHALKANGV